jgi:ferredoxin-type protein NapH
LLLALLLFPVVLFYLSPYVIVEAAARGIVSGSLLVFGALFLLALFIGRAWCAWACPGAGLQDVCVSIVSTPAGLRGDVVKWIIWIPWLVLIIVLATRAGGYSRVDALYMTQGGVSVTAPPTYVVYYSVLAVILVLCLAGGRRGFCHHVCWMAPFMILGRWIRNAVTLPALQLRADRSACIACGRCTHDCPMSLPVADMVQAGRIEHAECILCCTCADVCPRGVIGLEFGRPPV